MAEQGSSKRLVRTARNQADLESGAVGVSKKKRTGMGGLGKGGMRSATGVSKGDHSNGKMPRLAAPVPTPPPLPEPELAASHDQGSAKAVGSVRMDAQEGGRRLNRDLSWLSFNERVLAQAADDRLPLLERVRFLGIFTSNLDEFVMKRVAFLKGAIEAGIDPDKDQGWAASDVLKAIRREFESLEERQSRIFASLRPELEREGIKLSTYQELSEAQRKRLDAWHAKNVFPMLTPLAVDEGHKYPFVSNLSASIGVLMQEPDGQEPVFARLKVPTTLGGWVRVPSEDREIASPSSLPRGIWVPLHEVVAANLDDVFPGLEILEAMPFRVTRAAEWEDDDKEDHDSENLLIEVTESLKRRRFLPVVRLEVPREISPHLLRSLTEMLEVTPADVDFIQGLVDYKSLFEIADLARPELKFKPWAAVVPPSLRDRSKSIFAQIRRGDVLVHHPYESFEQSATRFVKEAAEDPQTLVIKQTIYRTNRESPFVKHLIAAAEAGKQVACLVELRARFDEGRNVKLAQLLEKAGVHVAYGVIGLKTHCKAAMVVRREADGLRTYAHIGTGNYNPQTAQVYTDLGLFTCDPRITEDVTHLFNLLTGRSLKDSYNKLLVAPATMKSTFLKLIAKEAQIAAAFRAGKSLVGGRIIAKMNALEDPDVIEALYEASNEGVQIDLFVRGFCTLRAGIEGLSENIRVRSVVGRFLEHSRIFYFASGASDPLDGQWFIGSADWMSRNLNSRVESACPVLDIRTKHKLAQIISIMDQDRTNAWLLGPDGRYARLAPGPGVKPNSPERLGTFDALMALSLSE